jgi:hypothetical protein
VQNLHRGSSTITFITISTHQISFANVMFSPISGVAVGSSIGHAIGGFFGGGSNSTPVQEAASPQQAQEAQQAYGQASQFSSQQQGGSGVCGNEVTGFKRCMDENQGNLTICGWYLDQLKACQSAASQY